MQGIEAVIDEVPFAGAGEFRKVSREVVVWSAFALAAVSALALAVALERRNAPSSSDVPEIRPAAVAVSARPANSPFGDMVIEPEWRATLAIEGHAQQPATASIPLPKLDLFPPETTARLEAAPPSETIGPEAQPVPPERQQSELGESVPLPPPRPQEFQQSAPAERRVARQTPPAAPVGPADNRNIFQKLLGLGESSVQNPSAPVVASRQAVAGSRPSGQEETAVASAAPEGRGGWRTFFPSFGSTVANPTSRYDQYTAVYDISARVLYLPDGRRIEAHSGLGDKLDNPRFVSERMQGATPPHLYELTLREGSFHGVQALRLTPIGEGGIYGRAGLLAHPYMLGPNGASNGCVSVRDYDAFLRAYENGQIKRLAVVASL